MTWVADASVAANRIVQAGGAAGTTSTLGTRATQATGAKLFTGS